MSKYETVIFDLDGTLIDSSKGIVLAVEETMDILGYDKIPRVEIESFIGPPIGNSIIKRNRLGEAELNRFNPLFRDIYKEKYLLDAAIYPNIEDLLYDLRGKIKIGIATNKRDDATRILLDHLKILNLFDHVSGQNKNGTLKKTDTVEECLKVMHSDRNRTVMVGDTTMDSSAAEKCKIDFIGVTFGFGFKTDVDVHYGQTVDSVQMLRDILLN